MKNSKKKKVDLKFMLIGMKGKGWRENKGKMEEDHSRKKMQIKMPKNG